MSDAEKSEKKEKKEEAPKALMIFKDANDNVLQSEQKGKGRLPDGAVENEDGNYILTGCVQTDDGTILTPKAQVAKPKCGHDGDPIAYITLDKDGIEIKRERKGRGRPRKEFVKVDGVDHPLCGHFVTSPFEVAEATSKEEQEETPDVSAKGDTSEVDAYEAEAEGLNFSGLESSIEGAEDGKQLLI